MGLIIATAINVFLFSLIGLACYVGKRRKIGWSVWGATALLLVVVCAWSWSTYPYFPSQTHLVRDYGEVTEVHLRGCVQVPELNSDNI